jgi:hypothetical protein
MASVTIPGVGGVFVDAHAWRIYFPTFHSFQIPEFFQMPIGIMKTSQLCACQWPN